MKTCTSNQQTPRAVKPVDSMSWLELKSLIIVHPKLGSIRKAAAALHKSESSIRKATEGKCPDVARRLEKLLAA